MGVDNMKAQPNRRAYIDALRRMTPEQRLLKAVELSVTTHELLRDGIRKRFPDADESAVQRIYLERLDRCRR